MREQIKCSRMKKPLPFVLGGARVVPAVAILEPQFFPKGFIKN